MAVSGRSASRWFVGSVLLGATLVLAACGSTASVSSGSVNPPTVLPAGAVVVHPTPTPPLPTNCTASDPPLSPMPDSGQMPAGSWMAHIQARGYLIAGVAQDTYLWAYRNPGTAQLEGFDVDMLEQVNQAIFGPNPPPSTSRSCPTPTGPRPWPPARSTSWPRR